MLRQRNIRTHGGPFLVSFCSINEEETNGSQDDDGYDRDDDVVH
jgi:hypothetical protein